MNFKRNLKRLRKIKGITQIEMAKLLNLDINTYRYMEQETKPSKTINLELLKKITIILECDYNTILE